MVRSILEKINNIWNKKPIDPIIKGIVSEERVYCGPKTVQIDITNNCNLNCVGCWCHSNLLGNSKMTLKDKGQLIGFEKIISLIDEFSELGVKDIILAGSGEPFMHPNIMQVIEHIKKSGIKLTVITNFTLVDKKKIEKMIYLGVDNITASIWAGDPDTYVKTHPNQNKDTFLRLKENLRYLHDTKIKLSKRRVPKLKIYNVISSLNHDKIKEMVNFGLYVGAENMEFQVIDIIEGKTDSLKLTKEHAKSILEQFETINKENNIIGEKSRKPDLSYADKEEMALKEFLRIIRKESYLPGFRYNLKDTSSYYITCPASRGQKPTGTGEHSLEFRFDRKVCTECILHDKCSIDKKEYLVEAEFMSIMGFGTFYRRIKSIFESKKQRYDSSIIDSMPCYIGWTYARILVNGDVAPCCKAVDKPMGNINKDSFKQIWTSARYNEFRKNALTLKKSNPYFKEIGCYKACDNVGMNLETHRDMKKIKKNIVLR